MFTLQVTCTDKGRHGRISLQSYDWDGSTISEHGSVMRKAPWEAGATLDGESAPTQFVDVAETARVQHGESSGYRFTCPKCGRDVPVNESNMTRLISGYAGMSRRVLDISLLVM